MIAKKFYFGLFFLILGVSSCSPIIISSPYPAPRQPESRAERGQSIHIPKGHLPPPGHCRIWYPSRSAGQQPPPQRCPIPVSQVPLGAYIVSRVEGDDKRALVKIYDERKAGIVLETRYVQVVE
jgi:hypothetical protein